MVVFAILAVVVVGAVLYFAGRNRTKAVVTQEVAKVEGKLSEVKSEVESAVKGAEKP